MKKLVFLIGLMFVSLLTFGSDVKKVAILDVVNKDGKLDYSQKLMLRSSLSKAVANTAGYEAYDRTDIDKIMSEHDFQRTGLVSEKEIHKLGEMTGASYILVAEGVKTPDGKIYVSVKLLNVETAKVEITDDQIMGTSSAEIKEGCEIVAAKLFNIKRKKALSENEESSVSRTKEPETDKNALTRIGINEYVFRSNKMNKKEYEAFLLNRCQPAYKQYYNGKLMVYSGLGTLGAGIVCIGIGAPLIALSNGNETMRKAGIGFVCIGAVSTAASVPLLTLGILNKKKSVNTFNSQCMSANRPMEFKLTAGYNGLGLAVQF